MLKTILSLANKLPVSSQTIKNRLNLLHLPESLQTKVEQGETDLAERGIEPGRISRWIAEETGYAEGTVRNYLDEKYKDPYWVQKGKELREHQLSHSKWESNSVVSEAEEALGHEPTYAELSQATRVPLSTLKEAYFVKEARNRLKTIVSDQLQKEISKSLILKTRGLEPETQDELIVKSLDMGWSTHTAFNVKKALQEMDESITHEILHKDSRLPHKVIEKLSELDDLDKQKKAPKDVRHPLISEAWVVGYLTDLTAPPTSTRSRI